jgi:hypothetical protein
MELNKCIICDAESDLNTSMDLTVDGDKYTVYLCDEHAEETTPKQAKDALAKRKAQLEEVIKQAEALGLKVELPGVGKKIAVVEDPQAAPAAAPAEQPQDLQAAPDNTPKKKIKMPKFEGVGGTATGEGASVNVAKHASLEVDQIVGESLRANKDQLENTAKPEEYEAEAQVLTTPTRGQIVIKKKSVGNTGTTEVKVRDSGGDRELQDRFKRMAEESKGMDNDSWKSKSWYEGHDTVTCTFCRGTGMSRIGGQACPKCGGSGLLSE